MTVQTDNSELVEFLPNGAIRCQAHSRSTRKQCGNAVVPGATVCYLHGGKAPQVRRKAALRLLELVDPAIATLAREMVNGARAVDRMSAANSILDRAGYGRVQKIEAADAREMLIQRLIELRDGAA